MQHEQGTYRSSRDNTQISWRAWLPDTPVKGVVALSHGYGEHSGRYEHVGDKLTGTGYALYALDHRGHGQSGGGRGQIPSYDCLLDDYGTLIGMAQDRHPDVPLFIYGHSMGGNIALSYAVDRPDGLAGVMVTGPLLRFTDAAPAWKITMAKIIGSVAPTITLSGNVETTSICRDPLVVDAYEADPLVHDQMSARLGKALIERGEYLLEHADKLAIPALLMHGTADQLTSPVATRQFAERATNADVTHIEYPGLYHELHNEPEQDEILAEMIGWLDARVG